LGLDLKRWKGLLLGGFAALGLVGLCFHAARFFWGTSDFSTGARYPSGDGRFVAVLHGRQGGGGLAPYCYDEIAVFTDKQVAQGRMRGEPVYVGGCGGSEPLVRWTAAGELQIGIELSLVTEGVSQVELHDSAPGGSPRIVFIDLTRAKGAGL